MVAVGTIIADRPAQIRMCAFTHTALAEDEWRRSDHWDGNAGCVEESTGPSMGRAVPAHLRTLTATDQSTPPQPANTTPE